MTSAEAHPHPALRGAFSCRVVAAVVDRGYNAPMTRGAPPLPLARAGRGEGTPQRAH